MLSFRILVLFSLMVVCNCRQSVDIAGPTGDDAFSKCNSGGERDENYKHPLGHLDDYKLNYEDIDSLTSVIIHFRNMQLETKAVKNAAVPYLLLHDYVKATDHKEYYGTVGYDAVCGWASQLVRISIKVNIFKSGNIVLENGLKAGSWGAVSCAYVTSGIGKVQIIY
ncbi:uncharacterized protein LOC113231981 [Hyposmocoma kahamanoa]|uniref:uncharacterized protein LOC113231981 n=1 Tax=Hyposmocoma kahamanoa TaxID=1477025 RepID=UPI000E6D7342|nr:uncharacterized protein LOC113231981 [Hyposmocoma kahamanoa]